MNEKENSNKYIQTALEFGEKSSGISQNSLESSIENGVHPGGFHYKVDEPAPDNDTGFDMRLTGTRNGDLEEFFDYQENQESEILKEYQQLQKYNPNEMGENIFSNRNRIKGELSKLEEAGHEIGIRNKEKTDTAKLWNTYIDSLRQIGYFSENSRDD